MPTINRSRFVRDVAVTLVLLVALSSGNPGVLSSRKFERTDRWHADIPVAAGIPARRGEFRSIVSVNSNLVPQQHICAGTLVTAVYVLTSAECVHSGAAPEFYLVADDMYNTRHTSDPIRQTRRLQRITMHPFYKDESSTPAYNMAMLKAQRPFDLTTTLVPIEQADGAGWQAQWNASAVCRMAGWGVARNGVSTTRLQKKRMQVTSADECTESYGLMSAGHEDEYFCADNVVESAAHGDIGAAMFCDGEMAGFLSMEMLSPDYPALYIGVKAIRLFMKNVLDTQLG